MKIIYIKRIHDYMQLHATTRNYTQLHATTRDRQPAALKVHLF